MSAQLSTPIRYSVRLVSRTFTMLVQVSALTEAGAKSAARLLHPDLSGEPITECYARLA